MRSVAGLSAPSAAGLPELIEVEILESVKCYPVQNVLAMNQEGLLDCYRHFSRNKHTDGGGRAKRRRAQMEKEAESEEEVRVMDEHGFMRFARDMGLSSTLPHSKLAGAFHCTARATRGEAKPVQDSSSFFASVAVVAMLVFEGENELTAREKVGTMLSMIDKDGKFFRCAPPILVGSNFESFLWEVFQNYCSVSDRKKGGGLGGVTSSGFSRFVKEFGILKGVPASSGRADTIFRDIVTKRANGRGGGGGGGGGGGMGLSKRSGCGNRMSFDDFIVGVAHLAREKNRKYVGVDDANVAKECIEDLVRFIKA